MKTVWKLTLEPGPRTVFRLPFGVLAVRRSSRSRKRHQILLVVS